MQKAMQASKIKIQKMVPSDNSFSNTKTSIVVFVLSVLVTLFWAVGNLIDVYQNVIVGVVFELLWLPVILLSLVLPIVCVFFLLKEKFSFRSLYLYSFLMVIITVTLLILQEQLG
jgi:hypothetical protein